MQVASLCSSYPASVPSSSTRRWRLGFGAVSILWLFAYALDPRPRHLLPAAACASLAAGYALGRLPRWRRRMRGR